MTSSVRRDRGAAAVELAIVLPLVLLIIGGIVDFGRFFFTQIQLTNAAREGARAAIVTTGTPTPGPSDRAMAALPGLASPPISVTVSACASGAGPTNATVIVSYPGFQWLILKPAMNLIGGAGNLPQTINATAVMKCGG